MKLFVKKNNNEKKKKKASHRWILRPLAWCVHHDPSFTGPIPYWPNTDWPHFLLTLVSHWHHSLLPQSLTGTILYWPQSGHLAPSCSLIDTKPDTLSARFVFIDPKLIAQLFCWVVRHCIDASKIHQTKYKTNRVYMVCSL